MTQSWFTNILQGTRRRSVTETAERGARKITEIIPRVSNLQIRSISRRLAPYTMLRVAIGHLYSTFQFCFICAKDWALKLQLARECFQRKTMGNRTR